MVNDKELKDLPVWLRKEFKKKNFSNELAFRRIPALNNSILEMLKNTDGPRRVARLLSRLDEFAQ